MHVHSTLLSRVGSLTDFIISALFAENAISFPKPKAVGSLTTIRESSAICLRLNLSSAADSCLARGPWLQNRHVVCHYLDSIDCDLFWCHNCPRSLYIESACPARTSTRRYCSGDHKAANVKRVLMQPFSRTVVSARNYTWLGAYIVPPCGEWPPDLL
jgi:hypothetical protein